MSAVTITVLRYWNFYKEVSVGLGLLKMRNKQLNELNYTKISCLNAQQYAFDPKINMTICWKVVKYGIMLP
jgi:hypothetical protein